MKTNTSYGKEIERRIDDVHVKHKKIEENVYPSYVFKKLSPRKVMMQNQKTQELTITLYFLVEEFDDSIYNQDTTTGDPSHLLCHRVP